MTAIRVRDDIYTQENKLEFIKSFDAAGEATITRVYNQDGAKYIAFTGEMSAAQKEMLKGKILNS